MKLVVHKLKSLWCHEETKSGRPTVAPIDLAKQGVLQKPFPGTYGFRIVAERDLASIGQPFLRHTPCGEDR